MDMLFRFKLFLASKFSTKWHEELMQKLHDRYRVYFDYRVREAWFKATLNNKSPLALNAAREYVQARDERRRTRVQPPNWAKTSLKTLVDQTFKL